jgi:epoxyqueuosine reductase
MIVIAVPRPQGQAVFRLNRESIALIIPPTYVANEKTIRRMEGLLNKFLGAKGFRVARVALPLKLLAVRSGLGLYGRNNICYVSEMGSFLQLVAFYSDLPCKEDSWGEAGMMESCRDCFACRRNCPTGAIPADRFLLRAERCIVFHNEKKGDVPFPVWMDLSWHNCLVGCMRCQQVCPHDRKFLERIGEKEEFSSEETTLLLDGTPRDRLPDATIAKLEHLDLLDDAAILPRNLRVFLEQKKKNQTHP